MNNERDWLLPPSYAALGERFCVPQSGAPAPSPTVLFWNHALAASSGWQGAPPAAALLCGAEPPTHGSGVATAYAGHQFGHFVPQLGDGRALLLGDLCFPEGLAELQLKGSGRTPFSRGGDGRAAIGPVLREVIIAEAMHALGIPSSRSLAAVATGAQVMREAGPLPGAVLARVAASHVRVGSFEFFAARRDSDSLQALCDWVIARHYPECAGAPRPALALLDAVCAAQAQLVAGWLSVGFVHGVMNTDNMCLSGQTIDYGPCAFLDEYQSNKVFSSIDRNGRYAYGQQPSIAQWNLARLAECLLPMIDADETRAIELARAPIDAFPAHLQAAWLQRMSAKIGIDDASAEDEVLLQDLLVLMEGQQVDFTLTFRQLSDVLDGKVWPASVSAQLADAFENWLERWQSRISLQAQSVQQIAAKMRATNPAVIPRNHQVEIALSNAATGDFSHFERLLDACTRPFDDGPDQQAWMMPPRPAERVLQTYCGT
jgi:uncharacterized protein YdiU (UPF0061 family)